MDIPQFHLPIREPYAGLILCKRYLLVNTVGKGSNGSIWIAYDIRSVSEPTGRFYALKAHKVYPNAEPHFDGTNEVSVLMRLTHLRSQLHKNTHCLEIHDAFRLWVNGTPDNRLCTVTDICCIDLGTLMKSNWYSRGFSLPTVKHIVRQVIKALYVFHRKLSTIHADMHLGNILVSGATMYTSKLCEMVHREFKISYERLDPASAGYQMELERECTVLVTEALAEVNMMVFPDGSGTTLEDEDDMLGSEYTDNEEPDLTDDTDVSDEDAVTIGFPELDSDTDLTGSDDDYVESGSGNDSDYFDEDLEDDRMHNEMYQDSDSDYDDYDDVDFRSDDEQASRYFGPRSQSIDDLVEYGKPDRLVQFDGEVYDLERHTFPTVDMSAPVPLTEKDIMHKETNIILADYGSAIEEGKNINVEIQSKPYRAPEVIMALPYNQAVDIWSLGCITFELLTGWQLFDFDTRGLNTDIHMLYMIEKQLGPIPLALKQQSPRSPYLFDETRGYHIKYLRPFAQFPIENSLRRAGYNDEEVIEMSRFLRRMLTINPAARANVNQLNGDPWLNAK